jgi:hypothetical protein
MTIQDVKDFCDENPSISPKFIFERWLGIDYDRYQQLEDMKRKINNIKNDTTGV